jgi:hypothetical protein
MHGRLKCAGKARLTYQNAKARCIETQRWDALGCVVLSTYLTSIDRLAVFIPSEVVTMLSDNVCRFPIMLELNVSPHRVAHLMFASTTPPINMC